ncbi:cytosolic non-specific dipeptidase, variant [Magnaporthiopsis poae ATCC 64411]|uniref:Cytosolic non-specific dipeptidase, variant n=1 Tax=Magnaporthiopsis poae (strain ATCC 64411 / 73-15) TaxID=644358 RepID=A0A0C4E1H2_MAGP6|nr:cytosolic non-specific dipeptidase, variant [Magnaporthiopsis poae ATCC 64411]
MRHRTCVGSRIKEELNRRKPRNGGRSSGAPLLWPRALTAISKLNPMPRTLTLPVVRPFPSRCARRNLHVTNFRSNIPYCLRPVSTRTSQHHPAACSSIRPSLDRSTAATLPRDVVEHCRRRITSSNTQAQARPYLTNAIRTHQARKMAPQLDSFFSQVDSLSEAFIQRLRAAVAIPSVSSDAARRPDVVRMAHFLESELKTLGAHVELRPLGKQPDNPARPADNHIRGDLLIIRGRTIYTSIKSDSAKRTILVYGHYDVQPAEKSDGWATEPFDLTVGSDGRMFGRGSTDDKGPVLGWLNAIEAHQKAGVDFPVNLLMCFEGMEEYGSEGLDDLIVAEAPKFFKDAEAVCISDNYWLGTEKPCLTYGLRGCNYYSVEISGPGADLHSGVFGGTAQEPMTDLVRVLSTLVDTSGKILIPGINEQVAPVTAEEETLYDNISFTMETLHESLGSQTTIFEDKKPTLMARWRYPSLSLHGVEGAFSAPGAKTVIPAKVIGKFSIRTVPDMEIEKTNELVYAYVKEQFAKLGSKNTLKVYAQHTGKWWVASPNHWNFTAAAKAVERVWGVAPDFTREGGSIPVTLTFEQATGKNVLLLPMGSSTDGAHSINEKLDKRNYIEGIKLLGAYLHYVAEEPKN